MIARCQVCEKIIDSKFVPANADDPTNSLREYDALAGQFAYHIQMTHPFQTDEMMRVQMHASKMYAMNWATFDPLADGQKLEELRRQWRAQLLIQMATTTLIRTNQPAAGAAPSGPAAPGAPGK